MASSCEGDETTGFVYTFASSAVLAELRVDYGMKLMVKLSIDAHSTPVATAKLAYCEEIRTRNSRDRTFIEFVGQTESTNEGANRLSCKAGFRLVLAPSVSLEMFFEPEPG